ncbi:hypothetical protein OHA37_38590 [Streptomyces sp. NBC_00335]|uniref:hypothetical protein n=1 Tax=unclassified Streptomyces TaxID=2593676 RepID=UPI00224EFD90|nr:MULTISPECIES: hypothetical protein [unclassified Streptomyces]MCX5409751.1 hypothetical protein [Streptomyces sp. NBC_00086]
MTHSSSQNEQPHPVALPPFQTLLDHTNWASLATACGTGEALPAALTLLINADPVIRESALHDALGPVTHQNSMYEATIPVALYAAAILNHPAITAGDDNPDVETQNHPTLLRLLDWLGDTAYDANDECVATGERVFDESFLDESEEMRAFRKARPAIFSAVHPLLGHDDEAVRHTALVTAIPLIEHPLLTPHQADLADHARRLLAVSTDRHHRDRVLDALKAWGHDTSESENESDIAAREHYAHLRAARASWDGNWTGGYSDDPPF